MWRVRQRLTQPASGSGNTIFQIGENDISLPSASCLEVGWAKYVPMHSELSLLPMMTDNLKVVVQHLNLLMQTWSQQMTSLSLVRAWDSRRWSDGHGDIGHLEDDWPVATLNIISSCHCYHSHCHPWWSSSANNSFSENIDRENRYSEWHSELLIWENE